MANSMIEPQPTDHNVVHLEDVMGVMCCTCTCVKCYDREAQMNSTKRYATGCICPDCELCRDSR